MSDLLDVPVTTLAGQATTLREADRRRAGAGGQRGQQVRAHPAVRPLEALQEEYGPRGFTVVGVPCNQFMGQEPGTAEEIAEFCSATYGVTFPMTEKVEINGEARTRCSSS